MTFLDFFRRTAEVREEGGSRWPAWFAAPQARLRRRWYLWQHGALRGDRPYDARDQRDRLIELGVTVFYPDGSWHHEPFWKRRRRD